MPPAARCQEAVASACTGPSPPLPGREARARAFGERDAAAGRAGFGRPLAVLHSTRANAIERTRS